MTAPETVGVLSARAKRYRARSAASRGSYSMAAYWDTPQKCYFTLGFCILNF
jgi:hypothetical protein